MRPPVKRTLTGLLIAGALAFSAVGAHAMGGGNANGPDAYIGIIGGGHPAYGYSAGGDYQGGDYQGGGYQGGGYQANTGRQHGHHGYGVNNRGYYHGY